MTNTVPQAQCHALKIYPEHCHVRSGFLGKQLHDEQSMKMEAIQYTYGLRNGGASLLALCCILHLSLKAAVLGAQHPEAGESGMAI